MGFLYKAIVAESGVVRGCVGAFMRGVGCVVR
jgi:hypothetical protein